MKKKRSIYAFSQVMGQILVQKSFQLLFFLSNKEAPSFFKDHDTAHFFSNKK